MVAIFFPQFFHLWVGSPVGSVPNMAPRSKPTISKKHKEAIRASAIARHAARKEAGLPSPSGVAYKTAAPAADHTMAEHGTFRGLYKTVPASHEETGHNPAYFTPTTSPSETPPLGPPAPAAAPRVILRDDGTPSLPKLSPPPKTLPEAPRPPVDPAPRLAFTAWLGSPVGRGASDPRMSSSPSRMAAELEHALWLAFQAGLAEGGKGE